MKATKRNLLLCLGLVVAAGIIYSCQKDKDVQPNVKGEAVFSFSSVIAKDAPVAKSGGLDNAANVVITVRNSNGELVLSQEQLPLIKMGGSFITRPISLLVGDYELTEFIVTDAQGNALYAAPLSGSPKAYLVDNPLPIAFTISKDEVNKIVPEVLSTESSTPEDFGYSTFSFTVVETFDFLIAVMVYNYGIENFELTTASLTVTAEGVTLYTADLEAITSQITVRDGYDSYIINVTKSGYLPHTDTLTNQQLKRHFSSEDDGPLIVILEEDGACQMGTVTDIDGNVYKTVKIGEQWWMAENLRVTHYRNGDAIPTGHTGDEWVGLTTGAYAVYPHTQIDGLNSEAEVLETYGGLYNCYAVDDARGLCPSGWSVPTNDEWTTLITYAGGASIAGGILKSTRTAPDAHPRWDSPNAGATNEFCFSSIPSGARRSDDGNFFLLGTNFICWTKTEHEYDSDYAYRKSLLYNTNATGSGPFLKKGGYTIRCIRNN